MIGSFKCMETEKIHKGIISTVLPNNIQVVARRKLRMIDNAKKLNDLRIPPGNRLEKLEGNWEGYWSIRINDQWRICFEWEGDHAYKLQIVDYHS